jgi:hypothetical protein
MILMSVIEIVKATDGTYPTWLKLLKELQPLQGQIVGGSVKYEVNSIKELKNMYIQYKKNNMKRTGRKRLENKE